MGDKLLIVGPREGHPHTHTIIFLHGRDSTASEFAEEFFESETSDSVFIQDAFPTTKWVFPTSKLRKSSRFDTEISQWFDMWSVENPEEKEEEQKEGLKGSISEILDIIKEEILHVASSEHVVLAGISQGCATAIHALLQSNIRLGGFIGLSSWLPFKNDIMTITEKAKGRDTLRQIRAIFEATIERPEDFIALSNLSISNTPNTEGQDTTGEIPLRTPVFLSHSQDDEVVPIRNGRGLHKALKELGMDVTWKEYEDGGHWINEPQGVDDIVAFLRSKFIAP